MFKMNRKVEYALMALKHMSHKRPGEISTAKEIAETYGCSFDTIARILQIMTQKSWLQSTQGVAGGYILIKDLAKVSFYDLAILILGPIQLVRCISSSCQIKQKYNIVSPAQNLNAHLIEFYRSLSLFSLLEENTLKPNHRDLHQAGDKTKMERKITRSGYKNGADTAASITNTHATLPFATEKDL